MAIPQRVSCIVQITAKDINGNNIAKTYNNVVQMNIDFANGKFQIVDEVQGAFNFPFVQIATLTDTIQSNVTPPVHNFVMS